MNYFIPKDTSELLNKNNLEANDIDNFFLRLHRFTKRYYGNKGKYEFNIRDIKGSTNIEMDKIEQHYNSIKSIYPHSESILATNNWRLAIGIGSASVYETSISLHHIYGVPYIPAQSIKGSLRSFIIEKYFNSNEEKAFKDSAFIEIFGSNEQRGKVVFFDAFTKESKVQVDIMNNHYQKYYNGKEAPTDTQNPNPINFLTLKGSQFEVMIAVKESILLDSTHFKGNMIDIVKDELSESLEIFGIGAKTSVGYGYFDISKSLEEKAWNIAKETKNIQTIKSFIKKYPDSKYIDRAKQKEKKLEEKVQDDKFEKVNNEVKKAWDNIHNPKYKSKLKKALEQFIKKWSKEQKNKGSKLVLEYVERAKKEL